jgi:hypothetical protein
LKIKEGILAYAVRFLRSFIIIENRERILLPVLAPIEAKIKAIKASDPDDQFFKLLDDMEKVIYIYSLNSYVLKN